METIASDVYTIAPKKKRDRSIGRDIGHLPRYTACRYRKCHLRLDWARCHSLVVLEPDFPAY